MSVLNLRFSPNCVNLGFVPPQRVDSWRVHGVITRILTGCGVLRAPQCSMPALRLCQHAHCKWTWQWSWSFWWLRRLVLLKSCDDDYCYDCGDDDDDDDDDDDEKWYSWFEKLMEQYYIHMFDKVYTIGFREPRKASHSKLVPSSSTFFAAGSASSGVSISFKCPNLGSCTWELWGAACPSQQLFNKWWEVES